MRTKDDIKQEALFEATVKLVNEIGFAASSVAKIAKEAGISPATIYVYYKNKEDLLVSTYLEIKQNLGKALGQNIDDTTPIRDTLKQVWFNMFDHIRAHPNHFHYTEQFANSPFSSLVNKKEIEKYFEPLIMVIMRGIEQKIIKNVDDNILRAFIVHPIVVLSNERLCQDFEASPDNIETAFSLAWDAIKL
ncbi:MAG: TetR/AcrR family transcriptional regulator [Desulfobacteraceae bacterium]|nr:TetR/AcrR family transcriptional regulator [Desulfobacteraceae bacterium]